MAARSVSDIHVRILADGLRSGAVWYASVGLVLAWASTAEIQLQTHPVTFAIATGGPMVVVLFGAVLLGMRSSRRLGPLRTVIAFVFAEVGFALFVMAVDPDPTHPHTTADFGLSLVKTAIVVMMINAGRRWGPPVAAILAAGCSELISIVLGPDFGYTWQFDTSEAVVVLLIVLGTIGFAIARASGARARTAYLAARDQDALRQTRGIVRSKAAAIVHDTVLNDLAVLATTEPGTIAEPLSERLSRTLDLLASPRWVDDPAHTSRGSTTGPMRVAIDTATAAGLHVVVSGDLDVLGTLDAAVERALAGAVDQCLTNTRRHAGTREAELTVMSDDDTVSMMVVDSGSGFDPAAVDADRLGIRGSVHGRIEAVGGSVRIFTKPGHGTSILLTVPRAAAVLQG